jgi:predicted DNA binding CopG/RHH family protein
VVAFVDASVDDEIRLAVIGLSEKRRLLYVVHIIRDEAQFESFQDGKRQHVRGKSMKTASERLKDRMKKQRVMTSISLRIPENVIDDLKEIAPSLGFTGYQSLIKAYISEGLRKDLQRLDGSQVQALTESLRKQGIADELISVAIADAGLKMA